MRLIDKIGKCIGAVKIILFVLSTLIYSHKLSAQEPVHFRIGEEVLSNCHVYSILRLNNGVLYVSTDKGLKRYSLGTFETVQFKGEHSGKSLFMLQTTDGNNLYCSNMYGEIFTLNIYGQLELSLKTPKKYLANDYKFYANSDCSFSVFTDRYFLLNKNNKWRLIDTSRQMDYTNLNSFFKDTVYGINTENEDLSFITSNGTFETLKGVINFQQQEADIEYIVRFKNGWSYSTTNKQLLSTKEGKYFDLDLDTRRIFQINENLAIGFSRVNGIYTIHENVSGNIEVSDKLFSSEFISCAYADAEGTIYLGTFNHGLIVIPDLKAKQYDVPFSELNGLAIFPPKVKLHWFSNSRNRFAIFSDPLSAKKVVVSNKSVFYDEKPFYQSANGNAHTILDVQSIHFDTTLFYTLGLKMAVSLDSNLSLLATSAGIFKLGKGLRAVNWYGNTPDFGAYFDQNKRCHSVGSPLHSDDFYFSGIDGTVWVDENGEEHNLTYKGKSILTNYIFSENNQVILATNDFGILMVSKGEINQSIGHSSGLLSNTIYRVIAKDSLLFISHEKGLQVFNRLQNKYYVKNKNYLNLLSGIQTFDVTENLFWYISKGQLFSIPIKRLLARQDASLIITDIQIGESTWNLNDEITAKYDQNSVKVNFDFNHPVLERITKIEYRLNQGEWITSLTSENSIRYDELQHGNYQIEIRLNIGGDIEPSIYIPFSIKPPFWFTWWFTALLILVAIAIVLLIVKRQASNVKKAREQQIKEEQLKSKQLNSEIKALRSQMNPHFIFNSLSSIQSLILKKDTEKSYDYVVHFAELVRNTLNYSSLDFISIQEEVKFLNTYLTLEKLRLRDKFIFEIDCSEDLDINVPSMIIQPFAENSIVHGLMHKEGLKKLFIRFEMKELLECTITDNGIGLKKAEELERQWNPEHKSFAMEAIKQRLALLNETTDNQKGMYEINDLLADDGSVTGTQVIVRLPYKEQY